MAFAFLGFAACALVIFFAGKKLSYYGDLLSELTGLGKAWIGMILMASVTSLPELMVGISSVSIVGSPDLAVGDIFGSCAFNLFILSMMDAFVPGKKPILGMANRSHILAAVFGILLLTMAGLGLFLESDFVLSPSIGLISISFALIYFISMRSIYLFQKSQIANPQEENTNHSTLNLKQVIFRYSIFALIIIGTALALPHFAEQIAELSGLGKSFVGSVFLAISTSLPEIAVSLAALRIGASEMAIGNLLGSNLFNVFILFLDDVFYLKGHLLKDASENNLLSVLFVIAMTAVAIIGIVFPVKEKRWLMAADSFIIFMLYLTNIFMLYHFQS
ncbi:MAG: sodium:calcium antiporter [Bacteroidia bacterium]|jgi:cation:H+ antiporter|nr:sodium:calcium antiporter [Bacteroidia bacterium]